MTRKETQRYNVGDLVTIIGGYNPALRAAYPGAYLVIGIDSISSRRWRSDDRNFRCRVRADRNYKVYLSAKKKILSIVGWDTLKIVSKVKKSA